MARTIFVGDAHACLVELKALLARIGFERADRLVMVGDLVVRGPDPTGMLDFLIDAGAKAVRGNHEAKLLAVRDRRVEAGEAHRRTARALRPRHWRYLEELPLWLDLPDHEVRVVHAGIVPGIPIEKQTPSVLMTIRSLGPRGEAVDKRGVKLWGSAYVGPPHIVFGHNARPDPQIHPWATGIDTGCVYGGCLTALVLREGEIPPPVEERWRALVSVRAARRYAVD